MKTKKILDLIFLSLTALLLCLIVLSSTALLATAYSSSSLKYAYITSCSNDIISVIDTNTNTVIDTMYAGDGPYGIAITPNGKKIYVTNTNGNIVSVIDTANNTIISSIHVGNGPNGITVTPDGKKVYVTNYDNTVSVIDTANNTVISSVPVGNGPKGIAITPDGKKIYVANSGNFSVPGDTVSIIDATNDTVISSVPVGNGPKGIAITPDGKKVYVANSGNFSVPGDTVSVIDTTNNTVTNNINVGNYPCGIAVNPNGKKVYVTNSGNYSINGTISVIDTTTNTVTATINDMSYPNGIAVNSDGKKVYVTNHVDYSSSGVSVIDATNNTVIAKVVIGEGATVFGLLIGSPPVYKVEHTILLTSPANQYEYKQEITLTAIVSTPSKGNKKPSGNITFMDGATVLKTVNVISGQATLKISSLSEGSHPIRAVYSGDNNFKPSNSSVLSIKVYGPSSNCPNQILGCPPPIGDFGPGNMGTEDLNRGNIIINEVLEKPQSIWEKILIGLISIIGTIFAAVVTNIIWTKMEGHFKK